MKSMARQLFPAKDHSPSPGRRGSRAGEAQPGHEGEQELLLDVRGVSMRYGLIEALRGVSMRLRRGQLVAVLGSNGAGKSSLARVIVGLSPPREGQIRYLGDDITRISVEKRVERGLCLVPEGRGQLRNLTVRENLGLGMYRAKRRSAQAERMEAVLALFPQLLPLLKRRAGVLSGGELQMLAIARALMGEPKLLLLDEPSMGLAPLIVKDIFSIIRQIRDEGTTILLVEQNASQALRLADRGYVLENGTIVMAERAQALLRDSRVRAAYLGEGAASAEAALG